MRGASRIAAVYEIYGLTRKGILPHTSSTFARRLSAMLCLTCDRLEVFSSLDWKPHPRQICKHLSFCLATETSRQSIGCVSFVRWNRRLRCLQPCDKATPMKSTCMEATTAVRGGKRTTRASMGGVTGVFVMCGPSVGRSRKKRGSHS